MASPEQVELDLKKIELEENSKLLAEKELSLEDIKISLNAFQYRYYKQVGIKYVELDELKAKIAELKLRNSPNNSIFKREFEEMRGKAEESFNEYSGVDGQEEQVKSKPTGEAKKLFRKIAAIIHPDKTTDERNRLVCTELMKELNEAYDNNDIDKMQDVLTKWQESPDLITGESVVDELVRTIRSIAQVKRRISEIDDEIVEFMKTDIYVLMNKVHEGDLAGRDILEELSVEVGEVIEEVKIELQRLGDDYYE